MILLEFKKREKEKNFKTLNSKKEEFVEWNKSVQIFKKKKKLIRNCKNIFIC